MYLCHVSNTIFYADETIFFIHCNAIYTDPRRWEQSLCARDEGYLRRPSQAHTPDLTQELESKAYRKSPYPEREGQAVTSFDRKCPWYPFFHTDPYPFVHTRRFGQEYRCAVQTPVHRRGDGCHGDDRHFQDRAETVDHEVL